MSIFLEEVGRRHADEHIIMFMDQAAWHRSKALRVPENIELAYIPAYSPDLNPQEQIWDELREKFLRNRLFKTLDAVIDRAIEGLRVLESMKDRVKSITHRNWILTPD
jgi:transposase